MSTLGDGTDAAGRFITVLKDLPLWLLTGVAIAADVLAFVPVVKAALPTEFYPWILLVVVLFNTLAIARTMSLCWLAWNSHKTAVASRRTFHMSPDAQQSWWSMARQRDDTTTTQISTRALIKNLTSKPLGLTTVRLIKPKIAGETIAADVSVRAANSNMYGSAMHSGFKIPPNGFLPASIHLMIRGIPRQSASETLSVVIGVSDDEGNEQRLHVALRGHSAPKKSESTPAREAVFSIVDPIEKQVASILQAELDRYAKHGRERGGLGSIHVVHRGRALHGVGNDSWDPNSPKNQSIAEDPQTAVLESDNLAALLAFYESLSTTDEKEKIAAALLHRLDASKPYFQVSYFIVAALWKVGRLQDALSKAHAALPEEEIKVFGLSNVLSLLNGLLRYRHPDFTPEALDQIEGFVHQLTKEHTFAIADKIAAIRTYRLLQVAGT